MTGVRRASCADAQSDPRLTVTAESFAVAPELLGLPLAQPWRRAAAVMLDLLVVAALTRTGAVVLGLGAAFAVWRAGSAKARSSGPARGWTRFRLGLPAAVIVFAVIVAVAGTAQRYLRHEPAADSAASAAVAGAVLAQLGLAETGEGGAARPPARAVAGPARQGGPVAALRDWADDLGFGFGWIGLYFTAFLALWHGQTPGKRLLGIRVLRLDGKPLGGWSAFQRFGGYAAGFATGLLGFAQVFWDRNRQAVHDKICETVVVRDSSRRFVASPRA